MIAVTASSSVDTWTLVIAVGAILFGGVVASWIGAALAHRHDRDAKFTEGRTVEAAVACGVSIFGFGFMSV